MSQPKNVIINGRACSGKDQATNYLVEEYGYTKVSFAEPIYWICRKIFRMKNKNRRLLQVVGQTLRSIDKNIWVRIALRKVKKLNKQGKHVVISDCRQANEYIGTVDSGFMAIRINTDLDVRIQRSISRDGEYPNIDLWEGKAEVGADEFIYYEIHNNEGKDQLHRKIDKFIILMEDLYG